MVELLRLLKAEPLYKEFTLGDLKVGLRTLTQEEKDDVLRRSSSYNALVDIELVKRPILAYSIQKINGTPVLSFKEINDAIARDTQKRPQNALLEEFLGKVSASVVNLLYKCYMQLEDEERGAIEELKKASADHSDAPSGVSSKK